MKNKNELIINEKNQIKRETVAVTIGCTAAAAILLVAIGCTSCVMKCNSKKNETKKYAINYGDVKVNGEFFENYSRNNIRIIKTMNEEYVLAIVDSNNNYYVVRDNEWYIVYLKDGPSVSLICEDGHLIEGEVLKVDKYLTDEEKDKSSFTFDDLINIENRLNDDMSLTL